MDLGTGATRPGIAHHPEIVFPIAVDHVNIGIETGVLKSGRPIIVGLLVKRRGITFSRPVNGGVEAFRRELPTLDQEFPGPLDRLFLEVISKTPVTEHFEEGVMIGVESNIIEIVVFAAGSNAFLRIGDAWRHKRRFLLAEKIGHELVHPRIGEKQIRSAWQ